MKLIDIENQNEITLDGDIEEWEFFIKLMDVMEPMYLIGILEHYDLCYWL